MGGFMTTMLYTDPTTSVYHAWCNPYITFCLFSKGRATTLTEAHAKCKEISEHSWPVELDFEGTKEVLEKYVMNYSISNVILNAVKHDDNWFWSSGASVDSIREISGIDDILVYKRNSSVTDYQIVCATECRADWTDIDKVHLRDPNYRLRDWLTWNKYLYPCIQNVYPYNISTLVGYSRGSHHIVNRSNKNIENCIGNFDAKKPAFDWSLLFIILAILGLISVSLMMARGNEVQFLSKGGRSTPSHGATSSIASRA